MASIEYVERDYKHIFLISPVRNVSDEEMEAISKYVVNLASKGINVYLPIRDTDQVDPVGLRICEDNLEAIRRSDEVHIWYSPTSIGSIFDLGMAFALGKKIILANREMLSKTATKSFNNMILELDSRNH